DSTSADSERAGSAPSHFRSIPTAGPYKVSRENRFRPDSDTRTGGSGSPNATGLSFGESGFTDESRPDRVGPDLSLIPISSPRNPHGIRVKTVNRGIGLGS